MNFLFALNKMLFQIYNTSSTICMKMGRVLSNTASNKYAFLVLVNMAA